MLKLYVTGLIQDLRSWTLQTTVGTSRTVFRTALRTDDSIAHSNNSRTPLSRADNLIRITKNASSSTPANVGEMMLFRRVNLKRVQCNVHVVKSSHWFRVRSTEYKSLHGWAANVIDGPLYSEAR